MTDTIIRISHQEISAVQTKLKVITSLPEFKVLLLKNRRDNLLGDNSNKFKAWIKEIEDLKLIIEQWTEIRECRKLFLAAQSLPPSPSFIINKGKIDAENHKLVLETIACIINQQFILDKREIHDGSYPQLVSMGVDVDRFLATALKEIKQ